MEDIIIKKVQDWEFAEEVAPGEWETVDIQIDTKAQALKQTQEWANRTGRRCVVSTSIRYESELGVEDRGDAPGNPEPIIIMPLHLGVP